MSASHDDLAKYYPGDLAWERLVSVRAEVWPGCNFKEELIDKLDGHQDLAIAIYALVGDRAIIWIDRKIPALDGISPKECLASARGILHLKSGLMRMP